MGYSDHLSRLLMGFILFGLAGCNSDIDFSEAPFPSEDKSVTKPLRTTIFAGLPIDLTEFQVELDRAIPNRLLGIRKTLRRAACYQRKERKICKSADAVGSVTRDGAMKLIARGDGLLALVPIKAAFSAKGRGRASVVGDTITEHFALRIPFKVTMNERWEAKVSQANISIDGDMKAVRLLGREMSFASDLRRKILRHIRYMPRKLEQLIAGQSFQDTVQKSWRRLYDPIRISTAPDIWLRGRPISVSFGGFDGSDEGLTIRIAFSTFLKTYFDERPVPLMPMPLPTLTIGQTANKNSEINFNLAIGFDELRQSIEKVMVRDQVNIGTDENAIMIRASNPRLYPSRRFLALQLSLEADLGDEWFDREGNLYMTALPWFDAEKGLLTLNHVSISQPRSHPKFFRDGKSMFLNTPFSKWFRQAVRFGLNDRFEALLARANTMVNRKIGKDLWLRGRFENIVVSSISPRQDHLQLKLNLRGALMLSSKPPPDRPIRPTKLSAADAPKTE